MIKLIFIGSGGHANSCIDVIQMNKKYEIFGFIGKKQEIGKKINKYKVLGTEEDILKIFQRGVRHALITLGSYNNPLIRSKLFTFLKKRGFNFPTVISPYAYVSKSSKISEGTIVMHGAIINSNSMASIRSRT